MKAQTPGGCRRVIMQLVLAGMAAADADGWPSRKIMRCQTLARRHSFHPNESSVVPCTADCNWLETHTCELLMIHVGMIVAVTSMIVMPLLWCFLVAFASSYSQLFPPSMTSRIWVACLVPLGHVSTQHGAPTDHWILMHNDGFRALLSHGQH